MTVTQVRHLADVWSSSVDKHTVDGEVPVQLCNYTDVYKNDTVAPHPALMRATATPDELRRFHLHEGDTVLTKDSEDPLDIGISAFITGSSDDFVCGYHLAIVRPRSGSHPRFLNWALRSRPALSHFSTHASGISRYGLGITDLRATPISVHDLDEQRRIADFLGYHVARIDQIIVARARQARWLQELASAKIQQMVMASSTKVRPLQALVDPARPIRYGIVLPGPHFPGGVPIIKGGDIGSGRLERIELNRTSPEIEGGYLRSRVQPGDLVIAIRGSVGEIAFVPDELTVANLTQDAARIAPHGCDREWLQAALQAPETQSEMSRRITGATVKGINIGDLRRVPVPVPTQAEQASIGGAIRELRQDNDSHLQALQSSSKLLNEYKQSLITAAVAGELDVTATGSGIPG